VRLVRSTVVLTACSAAHGTANTSRESVRWSPIA
jgi:hypothetical protein